MSLKSIQTILLLFLSVIYVNTSKAENWGSYDSIINSIKAEAWNLRYSDKKEADKKLAEGLKLARQAKNEVDIGYFYRKFIAQKGTAGELDSARFYFYQGTDFYWKTKQEKGSQMKDPNLRAHLYSELAEAYNTNEKRALAYKHYHFAGKLYKNLNDIIGVGIIEINLGNILYTQSSYAAALKRFESARNIFDTTDHYAIIAGVYNSINATYHAMGDYHRAYLEAKRFLNVAQNCPLENELKTRAFFALVENEINLLRWDDAKKHLYQAERVIDKYDLNVLKVQYSVLKSKVLRHEKQNLKAFDELMGAEEYVKEYAHGMLERFNYEFELAQVYKVLGHQKKALQLLLKLEKEAAELSLLGEQVKIARALSQIYSDLGSFQLALDQEKKFHHLYEKELGIHSRIWFKEIEQKYDSERKEKLLYEEKAKNKEKERAIIESELKRKSAQNRQMLMGLVILILVVGFFAFYRFSKNKKKKLLIEKSLQAKEDKLRISRDLHDHIGAELTLIKSRIDRKAFLTDSPDEKKELEQISGYAKDAIDQLRKTIWATKNELISIGEFKKRIDAYVRRFSWEYELTQSGKDVVLNAIVALNLFRIVQEAIQNAVKHSDGNKLSIQINSTEKNLQIVVSDNGRGIDPDRNEQGYGMVNMTERVSEISGKIEIQSVPGCSSVYIQIPL